MYFSSPWTISAVKRDQDKKKTRVVRLGFIGDDHHPIWDQKAIAEIWGANSPMTGAQILELGMLARETR